MDNFYSIRHVLANALRLPVALCREGVLQEPEAQKLRSAQTIATGALPMEGISPATEQSGIAQYLHNSFEERFVFCRLHDGFELWVGPFLTAPVTENRIAEIIRQKGLAIRRKATLLEHYAALPQITEDSYYYIGKLVEQTLRGMEELAEPLPVRRVLHSEPVFSARQNGRQSLQMFEHPPYFMELEMTRLVTTGDMEGALGIMNRINTFNRALLAPDPVRSLKNSLICDCTFLARAAIAGGVSPEDAFALSDKLILQVERIHSIAELEEQEKQNLMEFVQLVHTYNTSYYSKPVRDVISYINNHLGDKLTLDTLAELAYMHPNYLSSLFKREMGMTLSRYILVRRIEEAKFFLRYTGNPISDIAHFYQFSSQSYFIRRFNELVGMTPMQYRKSADGKIPIGELRLSNT